MASHWFFITGNMPINMVKQLLPTLMEHGEVQRSAIGLYVEPLSGEETKRVGLHHLWSRI